MAEDRSGDSLTDNYVLIGFTMALAIANIASVYRDDLYAFFHILNGFLFGSVLYFSLVEQPSLKRGVAGVFLLGCSNMLVFYASFFVIFLIPSEFSDLLFFILPSICGALITLACLKFIWLYPVTWHQLYFTVVAVGIGGIAGGITARYFSSIDMHGAFPPAINNAIWLLVILVCMVAGNQRRSD